MDSEFSGRSEEEIQAIKDSLELHRKVQLGNAILDRIQSALEESRWHLSESLIELEKMLRRR